MFAWYVSGEGVAMRKAGLVVGLLLCASFEARTEAKRREPPTRSQALADCQARVPGFTECYNKREAALDCHAQVQNCEELLNTAESAFLDGRWHPSQGPWANCGDRRGGSPYGRSWAVQCSYLDNIDKDAEFREREAAKQREEAERQKQLAEKGRQRKAATVARLEQALAGTAAIPASASELRTAVAKDGVNPYERVKEQLAEAERILRENQLTLRDVTPEYEARIRALRERNTALGEQFALQESESLRKLTPAKLRRYSLSQLAAQTRVCEAVLKAASLAALSPDSEPRDPLRVASRRASNCLAECEAATSRAVEIHALQIILCVDHPRAQQALAEEVRRKNQIDRASGTRNLALDRELAEQKILLREERAAAIRRLKQLGAPYSKSKCSTLE